MRVPPCARGDPSTTPCPRSSRALRSGNSPRRTGRGRSPDARSGLSFKFQMALSVPGSSLKTPDAPNNRVTTPMTDATRTAPPFARAGRAQAGTTAGSRQSGPRRTTSAPDDFDDGPRRTPARSEIPPTKSGLSRESERRELGMADIDAPLFDHRWTSMDTGPCRPRTNRAGCQCRYRLCDDRLRVRDLIGYCRRDPRLG
jgi:hypothetical protein